MNNEKENEETAQIIRLFYEIIIICVAAMSEDIKHFIIENKIDLNNLSVKNRGKTSGVLLSHAIAAVAHLMETRPSKIVFLQTVREAHENHNCLKAKNVYELLEKVSAIDLYVFHTIRLIIKDNPRAFAKALEGSKQLKIDHKNQPFLTIHLETGRIHLNL